MGFGVSCSRLLCEKWCLSLLDPSWPWLWSSTVTFYGTCLNHREMICAMGAGIKLLVMLRHLFINCNQKHKVKLKQTQVICWESKHGLSQCLEVLCLCLWMDIFSTCISDVTIVLTSATNTATCGWHQYICETTACVFRIKLACEFSLVFSDLLVGTVLLLDLFSKD